MLLVCSTKRQGVSRAGSSAPPSEGASETGDRQEGPCSRSLTKDNTQVQVPGAQYRISDEPNRTKGGLSKVTSWIDWDTSMDVWSQ